MEIAIAIFISVWLVAASVISYFWLKKDYSPFIHNDTETENEDNNLGADLENTDTVEEKEEQRHE